MLSFLLRPKSFRHSLPLSAFLLATAHPSRAQSAPKPESSQANSPQLTLSPRPSSAIANAVRPTGKALPARRLRSLLMAFPEPQNLPIRTVSAKAPQDSGIAAPKIREEVKTGATPSSGTSQEPAPRSVLVAVGMGPSGGTLSRRAAPDAGIAVPRPINIAARTRFAASRVSAQVAKPLDSAAAARTPVTIKPQANPIVIAALPANQSSSSATSSATNFSTPNFPPLSAARSHGTRLPSRGGMTRSVPVEVRPVAPDTTALSASQLRLLAQLDDKLGVAQRRLNRAETRLSEGQKQLGSFNDVLRSAMLDAGDDARGLHPFVRVAQRYMGTPYVWGGESARGFDCSGFIMRVMRDLGYRALPHSAAEQFRYGLPIAKPLLKAGDVVFFANTYKPGISHVGIYLGRGRFIHAANSKVGTIVSNLEDPKWVQHYAGARRLLPANG